MNHCLMNNFQFHFSKLDDSLQGNQFFESETVRGVPVHEILLIDTLKNFLETEIYLKWDQWEKQLLLHRRM